MKVEFARCYRKKSGKGVSALPAPHPVVARRRDERSGRAACARQRAGGERAEGIRCLRRAASTSGSRHFFSGAAERLALLRGKIKEDAQTPVDLGNRVRGAGAAQGTHARRD